ncbi:MAG: hypothetical protein SF069_03340 [Phycisphaerae bacterium]|nr:hypothetical protein [Phycisphaerae bacterium]
MNPRVTLLDWTSRAVAAGSVGLAAWLAWPPTPWTPPISQVSTSNPASQSAEPQPLDADQLFRLCQRPLQQPLFDPPPVPEAPQAAPPPANLQLIATALGGAESYAVVRSGDGATLLVAEGEAIAAFTVTKIERGRIEITQGAQTLSLTVPWYAQIAEATP